MEDKVKEAEETYQAASTRIEQQSVSKANLDQKFTRLEADSDRSRDLASRLP
jgi:hypothetical protein